MVGARFVAPACISLLVAASGAVAARTGDADAAAGMTHDEAVTALRSEVLIERRNAVLVLGPAGTMDDVPLLMSALNDDDAVVRATAERAIWVIWSRTGDPALDRLFAQGVAQLEARRLDEAIDTFTRLIEIRPDFAEGWNKRATARFLSGRLDASAADCDEVLRRIPQHFGALSGYGLIETQRDRPEAALAWFEQAIAVNPNMRGVRASIESLRALLEERARGKI